MPSSIKKIINKNLNQKKETEKIPQTNGVTTMK